MNMMGEPEIIRNEKNYQKTGNYYKNKKKIKIDIDKVFNWIYLAKKKN